MSRPTASGLAVAIACVLPLSESRSAFASPDSNPPASIQATVEVEEDVYTHTNANNGAGPMWCSGSTCLARVGDRVFASGLETVPTAKPLNNCRWLLFSRESNGWRMVQADPTGLTREPSPIAAFQDGRLFLSVNPTLGHGPQPNGGPARPALLEFKAEAPHLPPTAHQPVWQGQPRFTEHSYRSLAANDTSGDLILFQNIDYTHAEWAYRNREGQWAAQGQLAWPQNIGPGKPGPIRVCYPNVALHQRAVHFVGVSDILEPNPAWRAYKRELTGKEWDYDFRRLFYTWTPDITSRPFTNWIEIASRNDTAGWISPGDLWVASNGDVHILWSERAIDERLRKKFFPEARQSHSLRHAIVRDGKILQRQTLLESTEDQPGLIGSAGRFHVTPDQRLFVVHLASGRSPAGTHVFENRLIELHADGTVGQPIAIPFQKPFASYFTAPVRAGSVPSWTLDLFGHRSGSPNTLSYAKVELRPAPGK